MSLPTHELRGIKATVPSKDNLNNFQTPGLQLRKTPELFPMWFSHHVQGYTVPGEQGQPSGGIYQ